MTTLLCRSPSLPVREVRAVSEGENSGEVSPQGTPKSVPRSVFLSSNPILRNNKFSPNLKATGDAVNALCEDFEKKSAVSHGR